MLILLRRENFTRPNDGVTWERITSATVGMASTIYVGLVDATFDNVTITAP